MSLEKSNTSVVIIGASASIGPQISQKFIERGSEVLSTYFSGEPVVLSAQSLAAYLDLSSEKSIEEFSSHLKKYPKRIGVLIFLAGILPGKSLGNYNFSEIDQVMNINFTGQAKLLSKLIPLLSQDACILMLSSISARRGSFDPIYAASKGALVSFVKSMASKLPSGMRINALAPGLIEGTTMFADMDPKIQDMHRDQTNSNKLLSIQDLADVIFDISQTKWAHLNGACIDLNGGAYV
jgi:3-oxoacyl-[acyl-carrier protein] reductase